LVNIRKKTSDKF